MKKLIVMATVFPCEMLFAQMSGVYGVGGDVVPKSGDVFVNVTIKAPARYGLTEGIDIAIRTVQGQGRALTLANVEKELERMRDSNDVDLPYKKEIHSGKERQKKRDFDRMLADKLRSVVIGDVSPEPLPKDFKTRDDFKNAYVQYKLAYIDEETKVKYAKKLGGMSQYKRDITAAAQAKWKSVFGTGGVNPTMMPSK